MLLAKEWMKFLKQTKVKTNQSIATSQAQTKFMIGSLPPKKPTDPIII